MSAPNPKQFPRIAAGPESEQTGWSVVRPGRIFRSGVLYLKSK